MSSYKRNCPSCNKILTYKRKNAYNRALKLNSCCSNTCAKGLYTANTNNKICCICKIEKSKKHFSKSKSSKDNFRGRCKSCDSISNKKYRIKNHKKELHRHKEWRKNNPDKVKETNDRYRQDPENIKKLHEYDAKYRAKNKEKIYAKQREHRRNNLDKDREKSRRRRAKKYKLKENYTIKHEKITRRAFYNKCFNCKSTDNLCIDHHRPLSKNYPLTLNNAVLLCFPCNSSKSDKLPEEFYGKNKCKKLDIKLNKIFNQYK